MTRTVTYAPEAEADLKRLYNYIAERSGLQRAASYVERIQDFCDGLAEFPERGRRHDDLRPGLRLAGFERRVAIAFAIVEEQVIVVRVLYGGRDVDRAFPKP